MRSFCAAPLAALAVALTVAPTLADETWSSKTTEVIWVEEGLAGYAAFSYAIQDPRRGVYAQGNSSSKG